jgi:hypothetical protein
MPTRQLRDNDMIATAYLSLGCCSVFVCTTDLQHQLCNIQGDEKHTKRVGTFKVLL